MYYTQHTFWLDICEKCENLSPIFMFIKCILKGYPRQNDVMWSKFFSLIFGPVASFQKIINNLYSLDSFTIIRDCVCPFQAH